MSVGLAAPAAKLCWVPSRGVPRERAIEQVRQLRLRHPSPVGWPVARFEIARARREAEKWAAPLAGRRVGDRLFVYGPVPPARIPKGAYRRRGTHSPGSAGFSRRGFLRPRSRRVRVASHRFGALEHALELGLRSSLPACGNRGQPALLTATDRLKSQPPVNDTLEVILRTRGRVHLLWTDVPHSPAASRSVGELAECHGGPHVQDAYPSAAQALGHFG